LKVTKEEEWLGLGKKFRKGDKGIRNEYREEIIFHSI
jgi:hypothetical protein